MIKIRHFVSSVLCTCLIFGSAQIATATNVPSDNTTVLLTGNGIATRLHEPVLKTFPNITTEFVRLPDESSDVYAVDSASEDWLFLGTPVYKHKQELIGAVKTYKKILCEKPVGLSLEEISEIRDAVNENQVLFRVNYALRFLPVLDEIKEFINSNDVKAVRVVCNASFNKTPPNRTWKNDYKLGGGILYSILPHFIDLSNFILGESDLSSVSFESSSQVPMNDITLSSKTLGGIKSEISIDLCQNFDELKLEIETPEGTKVFDFVDSNSTIDTSTRYGNGTLSATSEISPWRISFVTLLETLFTNPEDSRLARIDDAENVHKVLSVILENSQI